MDIDVPTLAVEDDGPGHSPTATVPGPDPVLSLEHTYASLPGILHARVVPTPVAAPRLLRLNHPLAESLGLDPEVLASVNGVNTLAGNRVPEGAVPVAMAYAGHQFGGFVPSLGDGRAVLLGELVDRDGVRRDLHLKGSGTTPFTRGGDGRAPLGPVLREYVVSEAMAGLRIPTTRSLAVVTTGERVYRERALPGAVLARVAASHVRVGTFEYLRCRGDTAALRMLADHVIARHYPACAEADNPFRALLDAVVARQSALIARWLLVGFVHGVMNTDNTSIAGETIDYGPCAFIDAYRPDAVFSSIDRDRALRVRPATRRRAVEPDAAGRTACCRCSVKTRTRRWTRLASRWEVTRRLSSRRTTRVFSPRSGSCPSATATCPWCVTCSQSWPGSRRTSPTRSAPFAMRSRRRARRRYVPASPSPRPSTPGRRAGASVSATNPATPGNVAGRCAR